VRSERERRGREHILSIATSEASNVSKLMNPKPRDCCVTGSRMIFGYEAIEPNDEKVLYNNVSSTSGSRLPMNRFAPTSIARLLREAYKYNNATTATTDGLVSTGK
jgi:hypothetical protein